MMGLKVFHLSAYFLLFGVTHSGEVARVKRQGDFVDDRKVVCYYANWAVYRQGNAQFTPQNINPYLCTHLVYAFGGLGADDTIQPFDSYQDIEKGGYGRFAALKTYNKDLKTMLAIGGWNEGSKRFSPLVEDPVRRKTFIRSAITFLRQYNFDGLDLDWEYPTLRQGGRQQDRHNYALLIKEMREAFEAESETTGKERLLISMAVPASLEYAGKGYDIESLNENLDFFNLLTYDYHSSQEPAANHHSPLYKPDTWSEFDFRKDLNIDSTVKFYIEHGASRHKLVLGIPTYGRSYTLANPDAHEVGSPTTGPGTQGPGTKEDGYLAYYEVCNYILEEGWDIVDPYPGYMGPYAHKGDQWVGFDNVDIAVDKAFYVAEEGLGGIMFWTIDNDDFRGVCSPTPYPIIESAKEAMFSRESSVKTVTTVSVSKSEKTSVKRLRLTPEELAKLAESNEKQPKSLSRPPPPSVGSRTTQTTTSFRRGTSTTPAPPTTPSSGPSFKCKGEGFYPHPTSCKKYYWCLDAASLGTVAHTFTCPRGLYFNKITDGCDFRRNVDCGDKDDTEIEEESKSEENKIDDSTDDQAGNNSLDDVEEDSVEDPNSLKKILEIVKAAGGVEGLEKKIAEEEELRHDEEERRLEISAKTKSRLSQLLNKAKAANKPSASNSEPEDIATATTTTSTKAPSLRSRLRSDNRGESSRASLLSRLASRRRNFQQDTASTSKEDTAEADSEQQNSAEGGNRIKIIGAHVEEEEEDPLPLRPGVFKPKEGIREKLRETLQTVLEDETLKSASDHLSREDDATIAPLSTPTITKNTRITSELLKSRAREPDLSFIRDRDNVDTDGESNKYVTIQRGFATTPTVPTSENDPDQSEDARSNDESSESFDFRPTLPSNSIPKEISTESPFIPTSISPQTTHDLDLTPTSQLDPADETDLAIDGPVASTEDADDEPVRDEQYEYDYEDDDDRLEPTTAFVPARTTSSRPIPARQSGTSGRSRSRARVTLPPRFTVAVPEVTGSPVTSPRSLHRETPRARLPAPQSPPPQPRRLDNPRRLTGFSNLEPFDQLLEVGGLSSQEETFRGEEEVSQSNSLAESLFQAVNSQADPQDTVSTNTRNLNTNRFVGRPLRPVVPETPPPSSSRALSRATVAPTAFRQPPPVPQSSSPARLPGRPLRPATLAVKQPNYEYEYYYDYLDDDNNNEDVPDIMHKEDYDLVPLANKVRILETGEPMCLDVGVFPHPFSCKKFVNCFRNPGTGIIGSVYRCPSYLAFDPVGGRCNWVNEIVCAQGTERH